MQLCILGSRGESSPANATNIKFPTPNIPRGWGSCVCKGNTQPSYPNSK